MLENNDKPNGIYAFSLPETLPAKFTCAFCGGPAISEIELFDEVICDLCYTRETKIREEADNQYCYEKGRCISTDRDGEPMSTPECDGQCARCSL